MDDIFHFEWQVDQNGYEIVSAENPPSPDPGAEVAEDGGLAEVERPVLDDPPIGGGWYIRRRGGPLRAYRPLESERGLAQEFASLPLEEPKKILEFANKYGFLASEFSEHPVELSYLEHGQWWYTHIQGVRHVVREIKAGNKQAMAAAFTEYVVPRMTVRIEAPLEGPPSLKVAPLNLISAMWLQIAREITNETKFRKCLQCPKWFPHGAGTGHKDTKRFCSGRCRQAWHRDQKSKG